MHQDSWIKAAPKVREFDSSDRLKMINVSSKNMTEKNKREARFEKGEKNWKGEEKEKTKSEKSKKLISAPGGRLFRIVSDAASQAVVLWLSVAILHETVTFLLFLIPRIIQGNWRVSTLLFILTNFLEWKTRFLEISVWSMLFWKLVELKNIYIHHWKSSFGHFVSFQPSSRFISFKNNKETIQEE